MMIKNALRKWGVSCLVAMIPWLAKASVPLWEIVPAESQLIFTATQNGAPVKGEFKTFMGTIMVDSNDLKNSSIDIIVDINSITASYAELKTTLVTPDWFDAKLFPKAEFKSTDIEQTGDKPYQAKGTLTIRDKSQAVVLTFTGDEPSPGKGMVEGSTVIQRTQFGIGQGDWSSTTEIKDEVTVNFKVVANKK